MDAGMPECRQKAQFGIVSFLLVYKALSGIGIPASWSVRYRWSRINPLVPSYVNKLPEFCKVSLQLRDDSFVLG
jgi:hypothetical protein